MRKWLAKLSWGQEARAGQVGRGALETRVTMAIDACLGSQKRLTKQRPETPARAECRGAWSLQLTRYGTLLQIECDLRCVMCECVLCAAGGMRSMYEQSRACRCTVLGARGALITIHSSTPVHRCTRMSPKSVLSRTHTDTPHAHALLFTRSPTHTYTHAHTHTTKSCAYACIVLSRQIRSLG